MFSFRMVFFYLVSTGWILTSAFYVRINQSINQHTLVRTSSQHEFYGCYYLLV